MCTYQMLLLLLVVLFYFLSFQASVSKLTGAAKYFLYRILANTNTVFNFSSVKLPHKIRENF